MPWIEDEDGAAFLSRHIGGDDLTPESEGFKDKLLAAYRLESEVGSFFAKEGGLPDKAASGDYDVWGEMTEGERLDDNFLDYAVYADNTGELEAIRRQTARETEDRKTLEEGGFLPTLMVGITSPINYIPVGGAAYRSYRTGKTIFQGAAVTSLAAGASATTSEAALRYSQLTRSYGESATNIGFAAILGGVLGAAPGTVKKLIAGKEAEINKVFDPEGRIAKGENPAFSDGSIGAAAVDWDPKVRGKVARAVTKFIGVDPLSRTITSDSKPTRQAANRLAENPLDIDQPGGQAVETLVKMHDAKLYRAVSAKHKIYKEYRAAGGKLKERPFNEEIGSAMRNGSEDPHIKSASDSFRKEVYDPIKKLAIEHKLLPEDVDVSTAEQYLNRLWNPEKITRQMPLFVQKVSKWLLEQDEAKAGRRIDEVDQDFKGVKIEEEVRVKETGEVAKVEGDASNLWRQTKKRRSMTDKLRDCLNA